MKVINFFGAPGAGKTTHTMALTAMLNQAQVDAQASFEFVKEYIHSNSEHLLSYQNFIFAQQERQLRILQESREYEFAVTASPLLLSVEYAPKDYPVYFKDLVFEMFHSYDNINFFIHRNHPFSHQGRIHDEEQSQLISRKQKSFLINHGIPFTEIKSTDDLVKHVVEPIMKHHRIEGFAQSRRDRKEEREEKKK